MPLVTRENFEELLVAAAEEMVAVHRGEKAPARVTSREIAKRPADAEPAPHTTKRIRHNRKASGR